MEKKGLQISTPDNQQSVTHSVRSRFAFSLGVNLLKALVTFATGLLVARGLGPEQYGNMMFLLGTFLALRQLLDVGSSTAFFTFLSQKPRSRRFVGWFSAWLVVQFLLPLLAVGLIFPTAWVELIWHGEQRLLVVLAFLAAYMQGLLWPVMMQVGESQRLTHWVQGTSILTVMVHLLVLVIAWWQEWLSVPLILTAVAFEWAIAAWVIAKHLKFSTLSTGSDNFIDVFKEFGRYCLPLVPYTWLGFAYEFADRWLLQNYGGSEQQAFYAVAYQFGAVAAIATSSILNIFWKEVAEAYHQENKDRVGMLYRKVSRGLFFVAACVAGFLLPWSKEILQLTLGSAYISGATTLTIMLLYPIHQSIGQITGTMLYATGRVYAQVVIGVLFLASSIVVTYFVLAPANAVIPGLGLGSSGLAGKMVIMQLVFVNVSAIYLARVLEIKFDWIYQPLCIFACLAVGWLAYSISQWLFVTSVHVLFVMLVSGLLYAFLVVCIVWLKPSMAGVNREEILLGIRRFSLRRLNK